MKSRITPTSVNRTGRLAFSLIAASLLSVTRAPGQLAHKGPVEAIALAANLAPYDVVSIRQNRSGDDQPFGMHIGGNRLVATNVPLKELIEFAYDVKQDLIFGLSGTVSSAHFDIEAKVLAPEAGAPLKLTDQQLATMIIPLLADRFQLKAHLQSKTLPVYELVVAHGGLKIKLSKELPNEGSWNINGQNDDKVLTGKGASIKDVAAMLSDEVHRTVIDRTGLIGSTDIALKWSDEFAAEAGGANVVSIFTAVEEQLGLKLQPGKGPVETLVVDHVEMPSED